MSTFIIQKITPLQQVASQKSATGTLGMRTLQLRELGGQWAPTYAVKVFSPQAEANFQPGQLVAASLRFRATTNQMTGQVYQDVVAEEIIAISDNNVKKNTDNETENPNLPF